ncbi:hypothetical protein Taro_038936 [Colocasia esculenta]|uniref:Uncharacterized protein n=1 Tax=Colocasia esculenta TaxID=4460 RepID=A0A843W4W5_COLES|nr:hypothetical protein [Colocasia esculenta]
MPNCWVVAHDKPSKHKARTDPREGYRPTKARTSNLEPRNTTRQYGKPVSLPLVNRLLDKRDPPGTAVRTQPQRCHLQSLNATRQMRHDKVTPDWADASSGVATRIAIVTPAKRQTHGMLHHRAAHKPHTYHTGERSMEKQEMLSTNYEGLSIHLD